MTYEQIKEANRYYWIIKGQLIPETWTPQDVARIYTTYFNRIWGNHESSIHEDGFELAWAEREAKNLEKVTVLGYD